MIFTAEQALLAMTERMEICRAPPGRWKEGKTYSVQPGRYQHHIGHVRVVAVRQAKASELKATGDWTWPEGTYRPDEVVEVYCLEPAGKCDRCR